MTAKEKLYQIKYRDKLKKLGLCSHCQNPNDRPNRTRCSKCNNKTKLYFKIRTEKGICANCGGKNDNKDLTICDKCRIKKSVYGRNQELKNNFNLTQEVYDLMLLQQDNKCAICKKDRKEFTTNLVVDHNHITKTIRGLLCSKCNLMLGNALENPKILRQGAIYLEEKFL